MVVHKAPREVKVQVGDKRTMAEAQDREWWLELGDSGGKDKDVREN